MCVNGHMQARHRCQLVCGGGLVVVVVEISERGRYGRQV